MAFYDEGTPRWEKCNAGGANTTAVTASTPRWSLVVGSQAAATDKLATVELANATTERPYGVLDQEGADKNETMDPYTLKSSRKCRIKRSEKLRVRASAAYATSMFGQQIRPTTTPGVASAVASGGFGRIVGGETIGSNHYFDFWIDEADWQ